MTSNDPRCQALAARQLALYLSMRRTGSHLFGPVDNQGLPRTNGVSYKPAVVLTAPAKPVAPPQTNVSKLRRKS